MKDRKVKIRKSAKKGLIGEKSRRDIIVPFGWKSLSGFEGNAQSLKKKRHEFRGEEMGNHAVTTPTTTATNAPRALKTFLDPEFLLLLLLPVVLEGLEPPEVLLGVPEEPPRLGVEVGFG